MDLRRYLFEHRLKIKEFSDLIGCSRVHISGVLHNRRKPSLMMAKAIEKATNGEVTAEELLKDKEDASN